MLPIFHPSSPLDLRTLVGVRVEGDDVDVEIEDDEDDIVVAAVVKDSFPVSLSSEKDRFLPP